jgi:hypothetical protein
VKRIASNSAVNRLDGSAHGTFGHTDAVRAALRSRWLGMQDRLILAGVQVPPPPLRLMAVQLAAGPTLRAQLSNSC